MEYSVFRQCILEELKKLVNEDDEVKLYCATKNNGIELWSVIIRNKNSSISPTIYLESYYEEYVSSVCDIGTIARDIYEFYNKHKTDISFDVKAFCEYDNVRKMIFCKLVNTKKNEELLKKIPHKDFLDLSVVFYILVNDDETGTQTVLIHNNHLEMWDIDVEELYCIASKNTIRNSNVELKTMTSMIDEIMGNISMEGDDNQESFEKYIKSISEAEGQSDFPMYVLTNKRRIFGATCMLYKNLLKCFANNMKADVCILPSSIHEVILIPLKCKEAVKEYHQMVIDVNEHEVAPEEVLSNNIYVYVREKDEIEVASM